METVETPFYANYPKENEMSKTEVVIPVSIDPSSNLVCYAISPDEEYVFTEAEAAELELLFDAAVKEPDE